MMFKVFLRTIGLPFLISFFILWPPSDRLSIRLFILIAILFFIMVRAFISKRLYLFDVSFADEKVSIQYITTRLSTKNLQFKNQDICGLKVSATGYPYDYPGTLRIYANDRWFTFIIIDKKLFLRLEQYLNSSLVKNADSM